MKTIIHSPTIQEAREAYSSNELATQYKENSKESLKSTGQKKSLDETNKIISELRKEIANLKSNHSNLEKKYKNLAEEHNQITSNIKKLEEDAKKNGLESAEKLAHEKVQEKITQWESAIESVTNSAIEKLFNYEEDCIELAYTAVCRIIGETAATKSQVSLIVKEALKHITSSEKQIILVSPNDYDLIKSDTSVNKNLIVSEKVKYGGCIIKFGSGTLDARIETQLEKLKKILINTHRSNEFEHPE